MISAHHYSKELKDSTLLSAMEFIHLVSSMIHGIGRCGKDCHTMVIMMTMPHPVSQIQSVIIIS